MCRHKRRPLIASSLLAALLKAAGNTVFSKYIGKYNEFIDNDLQAPQAIFVHQRFLSFFLDT